jgi:uncharacterized protein
MRLSWKSPVIAGLLALAVSPVTRFATAQSPSGFQVPIPAIVTSATGEAKLTPDRATIYVGVQSRGATAAAAARDNNQRQRAVIDAIVALGIGRQQISTENYNVNPETRFDQTTQKTSIMGYVVSNVVRVELQRVDQVAPVIDAALAKGANQINSLDFYASDSDTGRRQALADAIAAARGDAEAMARAAGGSLGPLLELSTGEIGPRPVFRVAANAGMAASTPIEPGEQTIRVSVTARWRFVPAQ